MPLPADYEVGQTKQITIEQRSKYWCLPPVTFKARRKAIGKTQRVRFRDPNVDVKFARWEYYDMPVPADAKPGQPVTVFLSECRKADPPCIFTCCEMLTSTPKWVSKGPAGQILVPLCQGTCCLLSGTGRCVCKTAGCLYKWSCCILCRDCFCLYQPGCGFCGIKGPC